VSANKRPAIPARVGQSPDFRPRFPSDPARPRGAELLFQIITEREERASIALATNCRMNGGRCSPTRLVAAIADRITFNGRILQTGTQSYRLAASKTASRALRPARSSGAGA
jgi:IstB-like ATP binding protein